MQPNPDVEKPYAYLALQIQQEPNSYETIIENDPLDLAELFGNVGGFWGEDGRFLTFFSGETFTWDSLS